MLRKVLTIAYNGVYVAFTDRTAIIFMFAAPLLISGILGAVFGGGADDISLPDSEVLIVNQDEGELGAQYVDFMVNNTPPDLEDLITGEVSEDADAAREAVRAEEARAALIIPPDFSQQIQSADQQAEVDLFYNPGSEIGATITLSVVEGITTGLNSVFVAQRLLIGGPDAYYNQLTDDPAAAGQAFGVVANRLGTPEGDQFVTLEQVTVQGESDAINLLSYFAPAMAILFMVFAMAAGTRHILEEQREWTLQRIITTPTPRWAYLAGRLAGNFFTGFLQMSLLIVASIAVSAALTGDPDVWGDNIVGIILITASVVIAATGLGLMLASISSDAEQAEVIATAAIFILALLGGSFVQVDAVPIVNELSYLTLNRWGIEGYFDLANNDASVIDILPNLAALLGMGALFFAFALWRFNRRLSF
ncbi:MAG: ABC transporter permease [Anaerolineales bacterium]